MSERFDPTGGPTGDEARWRDSPEAWAQVSRRHGVAVAAVVLVVLAVLGVVAACGPVLVVLWLGGGR